MAKKKKVLKKKSVKKNVKKDLKKNVKKSGKKAAAKPVKKSAKKSSAPKKQEKPKAYIPIDKSDDVKEIARLFAAIERLTTDLSNLEEEDMDHPDMDGLMEDKEICFREIIKLDPRNIKASAGLVEFFLARGVVSGQDLERLEELNQVTPDKFATEVIKEARALIEEEG